MSKITLATTASVREFFQRANWQGRRLEIRKIEQTLPTKCWQVGEFFRHHNWQGKPAELITESISKESLVTQTVKDFFGYLSWQGKPQVAQMPEKSTEQIIETIDTTTPQMNINDLSDLF